MQHTASNPQYIRLYFQKLTISTFNKVRKMHSGASLYVSFHHPMLQPKRSGRGDGRAQLTRDSGEADSKSLAVEK